MPVPSYDLPTGMYFRSIEGYTASDFEIAKLQNGLSFQPACVTPGVAYFIDSSGNTTDMNSLAIMPCKYSPSWYSIDPIMASYFSTSFDWSPESSRVGYNFIRHTTPTRDYPLSLAKKGYRTYSWSRYYFEDALLSLDGAERTILGAIEYMFWSNPIISKANTDSESAFEIRLTSSGYSCSDGTEGTWKDYQGTEISRKWIGVVLQAGGGAGGMSWINHVGGGGSGGGFWIGLVDISTGTTTITMDKYSSGYGDGETGAAVSLSNPAYGNSITVSPGKYTTGSAQKGTTAGGGVSTSGRGFITYKSLTGGTGGYTTGENKVNPSSISKPTPDTESIPLSASRSLTLIYSTVWWGGGIAGQGGFTPMGMGGIPASSGSQVSDAGQNSYFSSYGAGGGGSTSGNWGLFRDWPGGSGGYPFVCVGF